MPQVWESAFETFGIDSGSNIDSFAWGFPTWLLSGNIPTIAPTVPAPAPIKVSSSDGTIGSQPSESFAPGGVEDIEPWIPVGGGEYPVRLPWLVPPLIVNPSQPNVPQVAASPTPERTPQLEDIKVWAEGVDLPPEVFETVPELPPINWPPPVIDPDTPHPRDVEQSPDPQEPDMAIEWGDFLSGAAQDLITGFVGGGAATPGFVPNVGMAPPPISPIVTVDTRTGKVTPCRRRRRRRLLTSSDLSDLASLKTVVGGGAALNAAVVKAVRR